MKHNHKALRQYYQDIADDAAEYEAEMSDLLGFDDEDEDEDEEKFFAYQRVMQSWGY